MVTILFYREGDEVLVLDWLDEFDQRTRRPVILAIERLAQLGHEARPPLVKHIGGNIYELRLMVGRVNFRILFFWDRLTAAVMVVGLTKEKDLPNTEVERARERKRRYEADPANHYIEAE